MSSMKAILVLGVATAFGGKLLLGGIASNNEKLDALAKTANLTELQRTALGICHSQMFGVSLKMSNSKGSVTEWSVPDDVCVCQSRTMANVLKAESFDAQSGIVRSIVEKKVPTPIDQASLVGGYSPGQATQILVDSLQDCATEFHAKFHKQQVEAAIKSGHPEIIPRLQ